MGGNLLAIYHRLPARVRSAIASGWGYWLRHARYGPQTEQLVQEALERETWSRDHWRRWHDEQLAALLARAATKVPYYRDYWRCAHRSASDNLHDWPVLEKDTLRAEAPRLVATDCNIRRMDRQTTSGTTGKPVQVLWSRDTTRRWYALCEARCRLWYGVSRNDRWAILGGQLVSAVNSRKPPFWVWNAGLNQLYMSSYHLAPDLIASYLDALRAHRITYLWGYTSSLYSLAQEVLQSGQCDLAMRVVITNAEPVYAHQRQCIEDAFQCSLRETYGMSEIAAAASECERGRLHIWPEVGIIETLHGVEPIAAGEPGDLVCTGLLNADMPLVRYRVGDRGRLAPTGTRCPCGRTLPILETVEGRFDDVLYTADGRQIGRLDPVFKAGLPIREAQIIQEAQDRVRVRYVPLPAFTPRDGELIAHRLKDRMGSVHVTLEPVSGIPRGANGKFRAVICAMREKPTGRVPTPVDTKEFSGRASHEGICVCVPSRSAGVSRRLSPRPPQVARDCTSTTQWTQRA